MGKRSFCFLPSRFATPASAPRMISQGALGKLTVVGIALSASLTVGCRRTRRKIQSILPKKSPPPELDVAKVDAAAKAKQVKVEPSAPPQAQPRSTKRPKTKPLVIKHGWDIPTAKALPRMIQEIKDSPFDGVVFSGGAASRTFTGKAVNKKTVAEHLSALSRMPKNHGVANFIILYVDAIEGGFAGPNVDTMVQNVEEMARKVAPTQVRGIAFDNEVYRNDPWTMPHACPGLDRKGCGKAAFEAGKKMMGAVLKHWPDVVFLAFFGPWLHDPRTYTWINQYAVQNDWSDPKDLSGDFLAGVFAATIDTKAKFIDGGELYGLRSPEDFRKTALWMRDEMVKKSPFFPDSIRNAYSEQMGVGFGIYDDRHHLFKKLPRLDARRWRDTIKAALTASDLVWIYTERHDWWIHDGNNWPDRSKKGCEGPVSSEWKQAAKQALADWPPTR